VHCLLRWGEPPWRARWGAPEGPLALLLAAPAPPAERAGADARASPQVFSLDGYGESEQAAFGASAVLALLLVLGTGAAAALSPARRRRLLGRDDAALRAASCADVGRGLAARASWYLRTARRAAALVGARAPCALGLRAGARLIAELLLLGLLGLPLVGLLLVFSVWIVGVSAIATALPIATAAVVATPLWGVARLCGMAAASDGAREPG